MEFLTNNLKKIYTLSEFSKMEVVEDDNVNGMARVVLAERFGNKICLAGFAADPRLSDQDIRQRAYNYYVKLMVVLRKNNPKQSIWKN